MNAKEAALFEALKKRYPPDQYALLPQVRNGTGFSRAPRTADAVAMGLWPSRGLHVHGFEFKCSRADWLSELKAPEKAEEIGKFCNFWWVVVPTKEIVLIDEIPPMWGLLVNTGRGLKAEKTAPQRDAKPLTVTFVASVLRTAHRVVTADEIVEAARQEGIKEGIKRAEEGFRYERRQLMDLEASVKKFEQASGVRINYWDGEKLGEAVRLVLGGGVKPMVSTLQAIESQAAGLAERARAALAAVAET